MPPRLALLLPLLALPLIGCQRGAASRVPPTLAVSDRSPDGAIEVLNDGTAPDVGMPEHFLYLRPKGETGDGTPIRALDDLGARGGSFTYAHNWIGRRRLEVMTDGVPPREETVRLANGETVAVVVHR